jgi:predicted patatin/cPLA2 family phospholipase
MLGKPFIYDTDPLMRQVRQHIDPDTFNEIMQAPVKLCFNAVSLQSGRVTVFSTKEILQANQYDIKKITTLDQMANALLASSNQAVFMNPIPIDGSDYVDGGNREVIPTRVVVNNLSPNQAHDIYILSNNPHELITFPGRKFDNILDVLMRAITMFVQEVRENDLEVMARFKLSAPASNHINVYYIRPPRELDPQFPTGLRFEPGLMMEWMLLGEETARRVIEMNANGNFPGLNQLPF